MPHSAGEVQIVTLQFDAASFEWLQQLRSRYFPPHRNFLPAHLTLLHKASREQISRLKESWSKFERHPALPIRFTGLRSLGGGTALVVNSPPLDAIRSEVMQTMAGAFSRQDLQPFKAHVTVQNKVDHAAAAALLERLSATFVPRDGSGRGLMIWHYLGGPWSLDTILPFSDDVGAIG